MGNPTQGANDFNWLDYGSVDNPEGDYGDILIQKQKNRLIKNSMNSDFNFGIQFDRGDAIYVHKIEDAVASIIDSAELSSAATLNSNPAGGKHVIKCNGPSLPKSREGFKTEWTISVWIYIHQRRQKIHPRVHKPLD